MKLMLVTFNYSIFFGRGDGAESFIEMEVNEEEYARLQKAQESGEDFEDCEDVADLYERAYELADEDATQDLFDADYLEEGEKASELYGITIEFPEDEE
jgi:hypothetical protein